MSIKDKNSDDRFLEDLRTRLRRLADESPPAPRAGDVLCALRRRRARRFALAASGVAAVMALAAGLWLRDAGEGETPDPVDTPVSVAQGPGEPEDAAAVTPVPLEARSREVRERIAGYLESEGIESIRVEKRPGEGLSFALAGAPRSAGEIREDLEALFENFPAVRLHARPGALSYSLMAP